MNNSKGAANVARKSEPTIMFVKPSAISADDKATLLSAGVIVIEIDDPQSAKIVRAGFELETGVLLNCAAAAIQKSSSVELAFGKAVAKAIDLHFTNSNP